MIFYLRAQNSPSIWATFARKFVTKSFQKSPNLVTLLTTQNVIESNVPSPKIALTSSTPTRAFIYFYGEMFFGAKIYGEDKFRRKCFWGPQYVSCIVQLVDEFKKYDLMHP